VDRARVIEWKEDKGFHRVVVKVLQRQKETAGDVEQTMSKVVTLFEQYVKLSNNLHYDAMIAAVRVDDPGKLADTIAAHLLVGVDEKQNLLEIISPLERLNRIVNVLEGEVDKLQVDRRIQSRVKKQMEKAQKEYYLNEKMKAIQKELGRKDEKGNEVEELKKKIEQSRMPKDVEEKAVQELKRLESMPPMSAEATVSRNYLDWLIAVPWHKKTKESRDLKNAEVILNEDHYGLDKIKERILEFLAVRALVKKPKATILTFVGPPGVGKTSLAKSIARAMNRKFVRLSLGGVRDEAEIRGHRRTYIGAFPGQIIQMMKKAGSLNPIFLLDEVDKMSMDFRGDPSAALLEVLDPEQNSAFLDHYLDVEYDLSHVMFICTANVLHTIPQALRDRMEVLQLAGYTEHEKIEIAKRFLVPKSVEGTGLTAKNVTFSDAALQTVIQRYTREAGVRNLEREINSICRKVARRVVVDTATFEEITAEKVTQFLGVPRYRPTVAEEHNEIGVATGLAWTEVGGEILVTEATLMPGRGRLMLTGKLGDVMQESAQAAMSYVRSRAEEFGIAKDFNRRLDVHIHIPEGAIPKDGPSAGITLATALVSALARVPARRDVAMTGEITLRGKVLPIGGVKEKVLAAHRAGVKNIILPKDNEKDLADIPKNVLDVMNLYLVENMDEVLKQALAGPLTPIAPTAETAVAVDGEASDTITH
jgi:ATP-dependent Lon protease